tara:strand:+ start:185 stop:508 length:324 start_codon:yes stop_codon:yes gene_type:complete
LGDENFNRIDLTSIRNYNGGTISYIMNYFNDFIDPTDPRLSPIKHSTRQDPRWDSTPIGKCFFVPATEAEIQANKKRPSIPARCQGRFRTKAFRFDGNTGYLVTRDS